MIVKELLKKLIQAKPTGDNGELAAANVLADFLAPHGIDCRIDKWAKTRANFTAHVKSTGERDALLFAAHLDVVPAGPARWKLPPFDAVEADGKIHGRGSADMKGPMASLAAAIVEIVKSGTRLKGGLILAATAGEETDSCGAKRFIKKDISQLPRLAGVVIPEPTDFEVVATHRGMIWVQITTFGKSAHGSMPHLGVNAIELMNPLLNHLWDYQPAHTDHPLLGKCSMSINEIHGGKATNVVPDKCSVKIDIRTVPGQTNQDIISDLEAICRQLKINDNRFKAEIATIRSVPALETEAESGFVKSLCDAVGVEETSNVGFASDGPFFAELGTPVVIFGPGKPGVCHQPDEYIDIADLEKGKQYYKDIILKFLT